MEVQGLLAVPLGQTVWAVSAMEAEQAAGVEQQHGPAQQAGRVQRLHAQQALHALRAQTLPAVQGHMLDEVIEGVVDRQRRLLRVRQAIEVSQHARSAVAQFKIELAAGTELEQIQSESPPGEEACGVGAGLRDARIGQLIEPGVERGEEMADGLDQGAAGDQGPPALSFRSRARARSSATVSWWISWRSCLRRLCSASHVRTSGSSCLGT
jgi:hypothetical protein